MLAKKNRLAKAKDIQKAFARGRTFFSPFFNVKYVFSPNAPRFTVVVSTKVFKKAVSRNRLKRIVREYVRKNLAKFKNGDYVISFKPKAATISEKIIMDSFIEIVSKIR
jgi:ribonuclease P protein component